MPSRKKLKRFVASRPPPPPPPPPFEWDGTVTYQADAFKSTRQLQKLYESKPQVQAYMNTPMGLWEAPCRGVAIERFLKSMFGGVGGGGNQECDWAENEGEGVPSFVDCKHCKVHMQTTTVQERCGDNTYTRLRYEVWKFDIRHIKRNNHNKLVVALLAPNEVRVFLLDEHTTSPLLTPDNDGNHILALHAHPVLSIEQAIEWFSEQLRKSGFQQIKSVPATMLENIALPTSAIPYRNAPLRLLDTGPRGHLLEQFTKAFLKHRMGYPVTTKNLPTRGRGKTTYDFKAMINGCIARVEVKSTRVVLGLNPARWFVCWQRIDRDLHDLLVLCLYLPEGLVLYAIESDHTEYFLKSDSRLAFQVSAPATRSFAASVDFICDKLEKFELARVDFF